MDIFFNCFIAISCITLIMILGFMFYLIYDTVKKHKPKKKNRDYEKEIQYKQYQIDSWIDKVESLERDYYLLDDERRYYVKENIALKGKINTLSQNNDSLQILVNGLHQDKMYDNYLKEKQQHRITKSRLNVIKSKINNLVKEME